jgi:hypothetical protein
MPLRVEPGNLTHVSGTHHQLVADDELADRQCLLDRQTHAVDGLLGASYLAYEVIDGDVREVLDEMLGKRRPVRMGLATAWKRLRAGNFGRIRVRDTRFSHLIAPEGNMTPSCWSAHE